MTAGDDLPRDRAHDPAPHAERDEALDHELRALLHAAWHEQAAPDATPVLGEHDAATRACVDWLRTSWAALPARPVQVPAAVRARRPRRALAPLLAWRRHAAAALLLLALALLLRFGGAPGDHDAPSRDGAAPDASQPGAPVAHAGPDPARDPAPPAPAARPRVLAADAGRLELQSGPVRLVLLTPSRATSP